MDFLVKYTGVIVALHVLHVLSFAEFVSVHAQPIAKQNLYHAIGGISESSFADQISVGSIGVH